MYVGRDIGGRFRRDEDARGARLSVRVTDRDLAGLDDMAAWLGCSRSQVVVLMIRGALRCTRDSGGLRKWVHRDVVIDP